MAQYAHKGQILPLVNQMIPIDKETTFHASYDYHLNGMNQGKLVSPMGPTSALLFNGTNSYIDLPNPNSLINPMFTIAISFTIGEWKNSYQSLFSIRRGAGWNDLSVAFLRNSATDQMLMSISNGTTSTTTACSTPSLSLSKEYYLVGTFDGATLNLYLDGVLVDSYVTNIQPSLTMNTMASIGYASAGYYWSGSIFNVSIYNKVLSQQEIQSNMYKDANANESGLLGYWKLNEKEGPISFDSSGHGNDGRWNGGITSTYGPTVVTLKKEEGKFRGAVLIEPNTTNIAPYSDYSDKTYGVTENIGGWGGDTANVTYYSSGGYNNLPYRKMHKTTAGDGGSYRDEHAYIKIEDGKTYTISGWMKANQNVIVGGYALCINRPSDNSYRVPANLELTTEWQRYSWVYTAGTGHAGDYVHRGIIYIDENLPLDVYWCGFQVEERNSITSYTTSSRPLGKLWYPTELINPSAFTISCWFNIPHMHSTSIGNGGIRGNWYHPIVELAPPTNKSHTGISIAAGPNHPSYLRKPLILQAGGVNTSTNPTAPTSIEDGIWYHLTVSYDGVVYKLYVDGVLQHAVNAGATPIEDDFVLMVGGGYQGKPNIMIDELRIESRAISAEEAAAWAASGLHYNYLDYSHYAD